MGTPCLRLLKHWLQVWPNAARQEVLLMGRWFCLSWPPYRLAVAMCAAAVLTLTVACGTAAAQDDVEVTDLTRRASAFLRTLDEDPQTAFQELLANSELAESEEITRLAAAAEKLPEKYGAFVASEQVGSRRVGQDLVLLTFLYKAERFPVVWRFAFYRPRESSPWAVVSLRFDSKLLNLQAEPPAP